jgi:hypothetical protein
MLPKSGDFGLRLQPFSVSPTLSLHINTQPLADEVADNEGDQRHAQTEPSHFKEAWTERLVLCDGDIVVEPGDDQHGSDQGDDKVYDVVRDEQVRQDE